jgi:formylglycine-generating enzyme required for sulfatase activity
MGSEPWLLGGACCVDEGDVVQVEFDTDLDVRRGDDLPAVFIIWDLASLFCEMLTRLERAAGLISESQQYRLPTEAEWEYACHFGSTTARSSDDDVNGSGDEEWFGEWCADWYSEEREAGVNPGGPELGFQRVVRSCTAHREGIEPWLRDGHLLNIGFRVVLSSGEVAR